MNSFKFKEGCVYKHRNSGVLLFFLKTEEVREDGKQYVIYITEEGEFRQGYVYEVRSYKSYWKEVK